MLKLRVDEVKDSVARENFQKLDNEFSQSPILKGTWRFVEITFSGAVANFKYPHGLGFIPKDKIELSVSGPGDLVWNYDDFDRTNIDLTTTGALTVRALVGKVSES